METITITRRVYLEPRYLDSNIMEHLLAKLVEDTFDECTKEHGHILSIIRIVEIVSNDELIFTVKFEANVLKPEKDKKVSGTVCMLYKDGIFLEIAKKQKMLIPASKIKDFEYDEVLGTYSNGDRIISQGDEIDAVISAVQYAKKKFSCVGSLA